MGGSGNGSSGGDESLMDGGGTEAGAACSSVSNTGYEDNNNRKQNHCDIEKRRRDKMNHYITELASVLPAFNNNQAKLDKLSVLRMAVQQVKSLRSSLCSFSSFHLRPSFLSSGDVLKNLILRMASQEAQDNLFMVVTCDRGKVLFVSKSSKDILNQEQHELVGQSLFDILHKDDVTKVKEQISYFNLMPKELVVDSRTLQPIRNNQRQSFMNNQNQANSTLQPGARRSFFCRIKNGRIWSPPEQQDKHQATCSSEIELKRQGQQQIREVATINRMLSNSTSSSLLSSSSVNGTDGEINRETIDKNLDRHQKKSSPQPSTSSSGIGSNSSSSSSSSSSDTTSVAKARLEPKTKRDKSGHSASNRTESATKHHKGSTGINDTKMASPVKAANLAILSKKIERSRLDSPKESNSTKRTSNAHITAGRSDGGSFNRKQLRYIVMHCTGYLKAITLSKEEYDPDDDESDDCLNEDDSGSEGNSLGAKTRTVNCLVAVCRRSTIDRDLKPDRPLTFTCRYSMEGKFMFVDQRTTLALGYTPQQLIGTSHYSYCHKDSVNTFKDCHRQCILESESVSSDIYQFKRANGQFMWLQTSLKSFRNPWTKFIDYIVAVHTTAEGTDPKYNEGCVPTKFNQDISVGEASQSSSPASTSTLSSPSEGSKKSASPGSSSIGSSYSMESFASGASIQVLLNQIDHMKSGGLKFALDLNKKRGSDATQSSEGSSSARKSNDDSGNFSDIQSCSSFSSQNSASSTEFLKLNNIHNFVNQPASIAPSNVLGSNDTDVEGPQRQRHHDKSKQQKSSQQSSQGSQTQQQSIESTGDSFYPTTRDRGNYPPIIAVANSNQDSQSTLCSPQRRISQISDKPMASSGTQSVNDTDYQHYQHNNNHGEQTGLDDGNWLSMPASGQLYSSVQMQDQPGDQLCAIAEPEDACGGQQQNSSSYIFHTTDMTQDTINVIPSQLDLQSRTTDNYPGHLMRPVQSYISGGHRGGYPTTSSNDSRLDLIVASQISSNSNLQQQTSNMMIGLQEQQQRQQLSQNSQGRTEQQVSQLRRSHQQHLQHHQAQHPNQSAHHHHHHDQHTHQHQHSHQHSHPHPHPHSHQQQLSDNMMIWTAADTTATSSQQSALAQTGHYAMHNSVLEGQLMPTAPGSCQQSNSTSRANVQTDNGVNIMNMDLGNSNSQLIAQQQQIVVHCPQCAGPKCCSNQPMMMTNNHRDLNNLQLSSLAVDDLDENELLECLAACDPNAQLYNSQNQNNYPQYHIYRD